MTSNATVGLPNPFTPLAFLPPDQASHASLGNYVSVGCLAVLIWDILHNLRNDYLLLFRHKIKWPTVVYFISRASALAYLLGKTIGLTARIDDCGQLEIVLCVFFVISHASTAFLLFLRLCAVYNWEKSVVIFFLISWLGSLGSAVTIFWGLMGIEIGPTKYCTSVIKHGYIQAAVWGEFVNDTLVFIAIMFKLSSVNQFARTHSQWRSALRLRQSGTGMKRLTDAFLEDTQVYYLIAVILNLATVITFLVVNKTPSSGFRFVMIFPSTVVANIMACRVFRNLKLGYSDIISPNSSQGIVIRPTGGMRLDSEGGVQNAVHVQDTGISFHLEQSQSRRFGEEGRKIRGIAHFDASAV